MPESHGKITNPRVLIVGANGMLGRAWAEELNSNGIRYDGVDLPEFDLKDPEAPFVQLRGEAYSHVLNAAAWTDVDGAEVDEAAAIELNAHAVGRLAAACAEHDCQLVHISTDYVFAGSAGEPYRIDSSRNPVNAYGRSKAAGEDALFSSQARWTLIRTSWLYAPWGQNFVLTMRRLLSERDKLRVVNDQRGCPTSVRTLATVSWQLASGRHEGVWHVSDHGETTWHGFASKIAALIGSPCQVDKCGSDEFRRPAPRPSNSVLDISKTERLLGTMPRWEEALESVLREIDTETQQGVRPT